MCSRGWGVHRLRTATKQSRHGEEDVHQKRLACLNSLLAAKCIGVANQQVNLSPRARRLYVETNHFTSSCAKQPVPIRDRVKELRRVRASELADNAKNWRVHPEHQRAALRGLLRRDRLRRSRTYLPQQRNGGRLTLIDGHLRKTEAGDAEIPCLVTDLNDEEADLLLATYDPIAAMAEADRTALNGLLGTVHSENEAVQSLLKSLADGELVMLHDPDMFTGLTDPDAVPEPPDEPRTKPGDLWVLGNHRLLCGDSSKPEDVDRLLDWPADPPGQHRSAVQSAGRAAIQQCHRRRHEFFQRTTHHQKLDLARHPEKATADHEEDAGQGSAAGQRLLSPRKSSTASCTPGSATWPACCCRAAGFYIWGGYANCGNYPPVLKKPRGCTSARRIIWDKEHPVLTRKDFMGA